MSKHNPPTAKYYKCGAALDLKTVMGVAERRNDVVDELMELVAANPQNPGGNQEAGSRESRLTG